ncbi:MAG TPA: hypothetical protein VLB67_00810 [Acidimicrobiia bacterium]|nr:hypothetical protein [Acidimicrobiia bacterium]
MPQTLTTRTFVQSPLAIRRPVLAGAVAGAVWGVLMRMWMRYISPSPEFSWSGTLFILGASTIVGAILGLAWRRRSVGGAGWWRLSLASLLLLGAGGAVMWPSVVLGALAFGRPRPSWMRVVLGTAAAAAQIPVIGSIADNWRFGIGDVVLATAWYAPMLVFEAWAFSVIFAPSDARVPTGSGTP